MKTQSTPSGKFHRALAIAGLLACAGGTWAREDHGWCCERAKHAQAEMLLGAGTGTGGFDQASGRDIRNYPPDRIVDHQHMRLQLFIADMDTPRADATQTLTVRPIDDAPVASLTIDAKALTIRTVTSPGRAVSFDHDGMRLAMRFDPPLPPGQSSDLVIEYTIDDPPRGLIWTPASPAWPGRAAQLHTQGQPQTNSFWFPSHDFPNERLTTELIVTVPEGYLASSNGRLVERRRESRRIPPTGALSALRPYETFHWLQDQPHTNYLVTLVVGKFDIVDVGDKTLAMPVYVPPGRAIDVARTYGNTLAMTRLYERLLDEPYPWDRYAQLVVWNFEAGGMENTAATTMYDTALFSASADVDHDLDGLISHELIHQWFGDLITCNSWEHIWLNEGFATYFEAIWFEERDGRDGYLRDMLENYDRVIAADTVLAPAGEGLASKVYRHPWEAFRRPANPYPKGAMVLHMLRERVGDEVFWRGMRRYVDQYRQRTVETDQFRRVMEDESGLALDRFLHQWTQRPGVPTLEVAVEYVPSRRKLRFDVTQTQPIDADNPAFTFDLPVFIKNTNGPDVVIDGPIDGRSSSFEVDLEGPPAFVAVNPRLQALARVRTAQSPEQWLAQWREAPDLLARVQAARALGELPVGEGAAASVLHEPLRRVAIDANAHVLLRIEAVRALAKRRAAGDIRSLLTDAKDNWEVRQALSEALGEVARATSDTALRSFAIETLRKRAIEDASLRVRNASLRVLSELDMPVALPLLTQALRVSSQHDSARQTAIRALAAGNVPDALRMVAPYAGEGFDGRTRAAAIDAVSQLASQDPALAFDTLVAQLRGRENRPRMSAAGALVRLRDPRGVALLRRAAEEHRAPELAEQLRLRAEELEAALRTGG